MNDINTHPKVSIIIPVYNQEKYINECVESVLAQGYENREVIVVDDGSTDHTSEILRNFGESIRYIRQENRGAAAALNSGLRNAQGSFVAWLGSDDIYLPRLIELQIDRFREDQALALVYTDSIVIDSAGKELRTVCCPFPPPDQFAKTLLSGNFINGSTVLMRNECHEKVGNYDENLKASMDADMWFRLLEYGYKFGHITIPLVKYRWHQNNMSHQFELMQKYTDVVHLKAFRAFHSQGWFNDPLSCDDVAWGLARQLSFHAATSAITESIKQKFSIKRAIWWFVFRILCYDFNISLIGILLKIRRSQY